MDLDDMRSFLQDNHRAVLATFRSDGRVQMSPVTVALDDEDRVMISSRETAYKVKNLRRNPQAFLCLLNDKFFGKWGYVEGKAEVISLPEAMDLLVDYYRRAAGEHDDWDDYRRAMQEQRRVMVRIGIEEVGPKRSG